MDNDGGGFYLENVCVLALYGEDASEYYTKGSYTSGDYAVGGNGIYKHIHGISNDRLSDARRFNELYLGPCCYSSWTKVTCHWKDYPQNGRISFSDIRPFPI